MGPKMVFIFGSESEIQFFFNSKELTLTELVTLFQGVRNTILDFIEIILVYFDKFQFRSVKGIKRMAASVWISIEILFLSFPSNFISIILFRHRKAFFGGLAPLVMFRSCGLSKYMKNSDGRKEKLAA